jgi:hypothetical protein
MNDVTPISSTVVVQVDNDLTAIANRIRERLRRTTSDIIDTGCDLQIVKNQLRHGPFLAWIDAEFGMTARSAQRYMLVAEFAAGKNDIVSHLSPTVAYQLAAPSTPQAIKSEVISDIEAGKSVDPRAIEERIKQERLNERGRLATARRNRRQKAKSPAARKRHEAAVRKHQAEVEARSKARAAAAVEAVAILKKLAAQDFARLRDLLKEYDTACAILEQIRASAS